MKNKRIRAPLFWGICITMVSSVISVSNATAAGTFLSLGVADYMYLNDLNNDDAYKFRDKLLANGNWVKQAEFYDGSVWDTDFVNYGKYTDILLFTGHGGASGNLALQEAGGTTYANTKRIYANWDDIGNSWIGWDDTPDHDFEWAVFMACDAIVQSEWGRTLANGGHHIFGYRDNSSEYADSFVVDSFLSRAWGTSQHVPVRMIYAWELANVAWDEPAWAITGHKGNENDFIHFMNTGATKDISGTGDIYQWYSGGGFYMDAWKNESSEQSIKVSKPKKLSIVKTEHEQLNAEELAKNLFPNGYVTESGGEYGSTIYTDDKGILNVYSSGAISYVHQNNTGVVMFNEDEAQQRAATFIQNNGGMPSDAYVDEIIPRKSVNQGSGQEYVIGYQITYRHSFEGIPVRGTAGDAIKIIVDNSGVPFYHREWNFVKSKASHTEKEPISAQKALETADQEISKKSKSTAKQKFENMELVYWSKPFVIKQEVMKPAWRVSTKTHDVYVDAYTGDVIDPEKLIKETTE